MLGGGAQQGNLKRSAGQQLTDAQEAEPAIGVEAQETVRAAGVEQVRGALIAVRGGSMAKVVQKRWPPPLQLRRTAEMSSRHVVVAATCSRGLPRGKQPKLHAGRI